MTASDERSHEHPPEGRSEDDIANEVGDWIEAALDRATEALGRAGVRRFEICAEEVVSAGVEARDGVIYVVERAIDRAMGIRVLEGGIGFVGLSEPEPRDIEEAIQDALAEARRSRSAAIADFAPPTGLSVPPDAFFDPRATGRVRPALLEAVLDLEARTLAASPEVVRVRPARIDEHVGRTAIRTGAGLDLRSRWSRAAASAGAVAEDDEDAQSAYGATSASCLAALDLGTAAREGGEAASRLLGASPMRTARLPVIFGPEAVADLLEALVGALDAERVERGTSFFAGGLGQQILDAALTLVDDPWDGELDGACPFDGEGMPTTRKSLVARGVLQVWLDDRDSAARGGRAPNAQSVRDGAGTRPGPGIHTLVVAPGTEPLSGLLSVAEGGLYVHDLSGTHTVNEVTGELSLGARGWSIRGGAWADPVEGVTVSGTLPSLLSRGLVLSREARAVGAYRVPAMLVDGVQVAGERDDAGLDR